MFPFFFNNILTYRTAKKVSPPLCKVNTTLVKTTVFVFHFIFRPYAQEKSKFFTVFLNSDSATICTDDALISVFCFLY